MTLVIVLVSRYAIRLVASLGNDSDMNATCWCVDMLGYLTNMPCANCVKAEHARAIGKG